MTYLLRNEWIEWIEFKSLIGKLALRQRITESDDSWKDTFSWILFWFQRLATQQMQHSPKRNITYCHCIIMIYKQTQTPDKIYWKQKFVEFDQQRATARPSEQSETVEDRQNTTIFYATRLDDIKNQRRCSYVKRSIAKQNVENKWQTWKIKWNKITRIHVPMSKMITLWSILLSFHCRRYYTSRLFYLSRFRIRFVDEFYFTEANGYTSSLHTGVDRRS